MMLPVYDITLGPKFVFFSYDISNTFKPISSLFWQTVVVMNDVESEHGLFCVELIGSRWRLAVMLYSKNSLMCGTLAVIGRLRHATTTSHRSDTDLHGERKVRSPKQTQ